MAAAVSRGGSGPCVGEPVALLSFPSFSCRNKCRPAVGEMGLLLLWR